MSKYAIWFKPSSEWLVNRRGEVVTFETTESAEHYREMIDVIPPEEPNMEVKEYTETDDANVPA